MTRDASGRQTNMIANIEQLARHCGVDIFEGDSEHVIRSRFERHMHFETSRFVQVVGEYDAQNEHVESVKLYAMGPDEKAYPMEAWRFPIVDASKFDATVRIAKTLGVKMWDGVHGCTACGAPKEIQTHPEVIKAYLGEDH